MSTTILAHTACVELGLLAGYGLCWVRQRIVQGRLMVLAMLDAVIPTNNTTTGGRDGSIRR